MNVMAFGRLAATAFVGRTIVSYGRRAYASSSLFLRRPTTVVPHLDTENWNAHNVMVHDPTYSDTVVDPDDAAARRRHWPAVTDAQFHQLVTQDFGARTADHVCDDFRSISAYAAAGDRYRLVDPVFGPFRERLMAVLPDITDQQLIDVFELIPVWNERDVKDPVFRELWSAFDKECVHRYKRWSLNKILLFMDHWYVMRLSRFSDFVWLGVRKMARKPSRLNSKQLVQMMFYANTSRKFFPTLPMYDIEQAILSVYDEFTIRELGIVSLGFFKTQTPIRSQELVHSLYKSLLNELLNIRSIELAAFLKILRYCTKHKNADSMFRLMDALVEKVDEVNLMCCTHMALLGTNLLIKHEGLLKKVSQRMVDEISQTRLKDLERITLALTMFNFDPGTTPNIFEVIVGELRSDARTKEFEEHTRSYMFTLSYLAMVSIFPYDCISRVFAPETLRKCFGKKLSKYTVPRDALSLNNSLLIECADYAGPLLPDSLKESCDQHLAWHVPTSSTFTRISTSDKHFVNVHNELARLLRDERCLHVCYPLPHHPKANILFCVDADGRPVIIPETTRSRKVLGDFGEPPALGKWFAVIVLVRNSLLYYSNEFTGLTSCKVKQLTKLGYEPITLTPREAANDDSIRRTLSEKLQTHGVVLQ